MSPLRLLAPRVLLGVSLVSLMACDKPNDRDSQRPMMRDAQRSSAGYAETPKQRDNDITRMNDRLGLNDPVTPVTQGNNAADLETTRLIRRALLDNEALSVTAKNLTIVTNNQVVTMKGSVPTAAEHVAAVAAAHAAAGKNRVDDQIVVDAGKTADAR